MFLFLSKLLPLFIYPLGLTCLLLLVALVSLGKRREIAGICMALALVVQIVCGNGWMTTRLVTSLEWQHLPPASLPTREAIVVLGGGVRPHTAPRPWIDLAESGDRVIHGAQLYLDGKAPWLILSGGRIDWRGGGPSESSDMAQMATALGVPKAAILEDPTSLNTYENAVNVKKILEDKGINQILLVTSAMHMPRSLKIFEKQGIDVIPAPTDFLVTETDLQEVVHTPQAVLLNLIPDADRMQQFTRALKEYIGLWIYRLRGWA